MLATPLVNNKTNNNKHVMPVSQYAKSNPKQPSCKKVVAPKRLRKR